MVVTEEQKSKERKRVVCIAYNNEGTEWMPGIIIYNNNLPGTEREDVVERSSVDEFEDVVVEVIVACCCRLACWVVSISVWDWKWRERERERKVKRGENIRKVLGWE
jgi:hypothetical protein